MTFRPNVPNAPLRPQDSLGGKKPGESGGQGRATRSDRGEVKRHRRNTQLDYDDKIPPRSATPRAGCLVPSTYRRGRGLENQRAGTWLMAYVGRSGGRQGRRWHRASIPSHSQTAGSINVDLVALGHGAGPVSRLICMRMPPPRRER